MEPSKEPKRLFDLDLCAGDQQEGSQNERNRVAAKRQRTALETTDGNFEDFVAIMDRIQYMKTKHMNFSISEEKSVLEMLDVKVIRTKSPYLPSFEWEDFGFDTKNNPSSSEVKGKQGNRSATYLKTDSSSDAYERCPNESFDLNVEASLNIQTL